MRRLAYGGLIFLGVVGGCEKDAPSAGHRLRGALQVHAELASAGEQLDVVISYRRAGSAPAVRLTQVQTPVDGPGRVDVPVTLDLTACLADGTRLGGATAGCPVVAAVVLRDLTGVALDSTEVGPFDVREGATVSPPAPIVLQAAATLTIERGNRQLAWNGTPLQLPVVVRLTDRAGNPIAGRTVSVTPTAGGGAVTSSAPIVTDADGRVAIGYRLGSAVGAQGFRVGVSMGSPTVTAEVALVSLAPRRERIASGLFFSCAVLGGPVYCWGSNDGGALGNRSVPTPGDTTLPVLVSGGGSLESLEVNKANSWAAGTVCGLTATGAVYCWGVRTTNSVLRVANETCSVPTVGTLACSREPTLVTGLPPIAVLSIGGTPVPQNSAVSAADWDLPERLCAISRIGDALCWGANEDGAVGDGLRQVVSPPTVVSGGHKWVDISTAERHSCGVTIEGTLMCWGANSLGQLGTGDTLSSAIPRRVDSDERFVAVATGAQLSCGLTIAGESRCWGGVGATSASPSFLASLSPVGPLGATLSFVHLSVGWGSGCGITAAGAAWCWGTLAGSGTPGGSRASAPERVRSSSPWNDVSVGLVARCAIAATLDVFCWGDNRYGALGSGQRNTTLALVPSRVGFNPSPVGPATQLIQYVLMPTWSVRGGSCAASFTVQALDNNGYAVVGASIVFAARTAGASVSSQTVNTQVNGLASVNCTTTSTVGPNEYVARLAASTSSDSVVVSTSGQVPGPPVSAACQLCGSALAGLVVGTTQSLAARGLLVRALDSLGLPVAGVAVTFTKTSAGASTFSPALPATVITNSAGNAQLTAYVPDTIARVDSVVAVISGLPNVPQLITLRGVPAPPATLAFGASPTTVRVGQQIAPTVTVYVRDRYGNLATNAAPTTVTLSLRGGSGVLGGTSVATTVNGVATFADLTVSATGSYQLVASAPSITGSTSGPFTVVP